VARKRKEARLKGANTKRSKRGKTIFIVRRLNFSRKKGGKATGAMEFNQTAGKRCDPAGRRLVIGSMRKKEELTRKKTKKRKKRETVNMMSWRQWRRRTRQEPKNMTLCTGKGYKEFGEGEWQRKKKEVNTGRGKGQK